MRKIFCQSINPSFFENALEIFSFTKQRRLRLKWCHDGNTTKTIFICTYLLCTSTRLGGYVFLSGSVYGVKQNQNKNTIYVPSVYLGTLYRNISELMLDQA
jgi:hypothetical protein